jgi:dolichol-phosphate mannosyltransferase
MTTFCVIPTYNERDNLEPLLTRLRAAAPELQVLLVDDGSPDGTADMAEALNETLGGVRVHRRAGKQGLASAYTDGFALALEAGAERVVQMDADLSHAPEDVPRLLEKSADLVLGSRYVPGGGTRNWPLQRRLLSRFGSLYARLWLSMPFHDLTGGFKAWRAAPLRAALAQPVASDGYAFQVEMTLRAWRAGATITEVPIVFVERVAGVSKIDRAIALEAAWLVPALRLRRP